MLAMTTREQERAPLIDIPTAAVRLGIGIATLRVKIRNGVIPAYRIGGLARRFALTPSSLTSGCGRPRTTRPGAASEPRANRSTNSGAWGS